MSSLNYKVAYASSEDKDFPVSNLSSSRVNNSWQSLPRCTYPQHIILQLNPFSDDRHRIHLSSLKLLCHEYKIPKKIEIFLASDPPQNAVGEEITYESCRNIRRLGYVNMDSNERSSYKARERKTINIADEPTDFIKLTFHECYKNELNIYYQIGIAALSLIGSIEVSENINKSEIMCNTSLPFTSGQSVALENVVYQYNDPIDQYQNKKLSISKYSHIDPALLSRLESLEELKHDLAAKEEFDRAAIVKKTLSNVLKIFDKYQNVHSDMLQASMEENYAHASKLKSERDSSKQSALRALDEAERLVHEQSESHLIELSLSSIDGVNPSFSISPRDKSHRETSIKTNDMDNDGRLSFLRGVKEATTIESDLEEIESDCSESDSDSKGSFSVKQNVNELEGVQGYLELPMPEELNIETSDLSSEQIGMIEKLIGTYRTKCFLSKIWNLREAVLSKMCLSLKEIRNVMEFDEFSKILCFIIERGINDRVVQVYISSLILLDEAIAEFETAQLHRKEATCLLIAIISSLVSKLGENKLKVVDGAETALMSLALSETIGPSYIGNSVLKIKTVRNVRTGKSICACFNFLRKLLLEFRAEAGNSEKILDFAKEHGFSHKDSEVRDAAKDLVTEIYTIIGSSIFPLLEGLNDRQLKDYKLAFAHRDKQRLKSSRSN